MTHASPWPALVTPASSSESVYRVDKFVVPPAALEGFLQQVQRVDAELGALPGCAQNLVLIQQAEVGEDFQIVTLVEWASAQALRDAKALMQQRYAAQGFDPAAFMQQLGVRADLGTYRELP